MYIGIIGQGYISVSLALTFVDKGFPSRFDVDRSGPQREQDATSATWTRCEASATNKYTNYPTARARRDPHLRADAADRRGPDVAEPGHPAAPAPRAAVVVERRPTPPPVPADELVQQGRCRLLSWPFRPSAKTRATRTTRRRLSPRSSASTSVAEISHSGSSTPGWRRRCASRRHVRRGDEADREHLPGREHRTRRTSSRSSTTRWASTIWEVLDAASTKPLAPCASTPSSRLGRALYPARPFLGVEGARVRRVDEVRRAGR